MVNLMGLTLAEETAKIVPGQSRIVVVADARQAQDGKPTGDIAAGFSTGLKKYPHLQVVATELVTFDIHVEDGVPAIVSTTFQELWERHKDVAVIVFFVDLPAWYRVETWLAKAEGPRFVGVAGLPQARWRYGGYLATGRQAALIVPRQGTSPPPPGHPKTPQEHFDRDFQIVTPQNYDAILDAD
ncbi:MAG: hypothetical protein PCFJNLEI_00812 [Verrucomicrobiae bacterium]|nr:hypothetical protein [Verrucomicrobiae bacterium]